MEYIFVAVIAILMPLFLLLITWAFQRGSYKDHYFWQWNVFATIVLFVFFSIVVKCS